MNLKTFLKSVLFPFVWPYVKSSVISVQGHLNLMELFKVLLAGVEAGGGTAVFFELIRKDLPSIVSDPAWLTMAQVVFSLLAGVGGFTAACFTHAGNGVEVTIEDVPHSLSHADPVVGLVRVKGETVHMEDGSTVVAVKKSDVASARTHSRRAQFFR